MNVLARLQAYSTSFSTKIIPDLSGKVVLVTGGNTGIGKETCLALVAKGAKVYMGARSKDRAMAAIEEIKKRTSCNPENLQWLKLDLTDIESIKSAVQEFQKKEDNLHILINNAGVMMTPYSETKQGYEIQWGTNVVGHFALTYLLLPTLEQTASKTESGNVRVINISSMGHQFAPKNGINFEDLNLKNQNTIIRYGQSKLGNILLTKEISNRFARKGILSIAVHPGYVDTELGRGPMELLGRFAFLMAPVNWVLKSFFALTPAQGALNSLYAATSDDVINKEMNGSYLIPFCKIDKGSDFARDKTLPTKLWNTLESDLKSKKLI